MTEKRQVERNDCMTLYRLANLSKQYGDRAVLRVPELEIGEGETLALIGPSGAGKSTLLRLLALLESPTSGTLAYDGQQIAGPVPVALQRQVTLMFQHPLLLDTTVEQNAGYGLRVRGRRDRQKIAAVLEQLGLGELVSARVKSLSGGEQQRVALARALVIQPRVLLLDEPTAHLDPYNVQIIEEAIAELQRTRGTTIVLATHNLHQARRLATRTAVLLDGEPIEAAPTEYLFSEAADPRTIAFLQGGIVF